MEKGKLIGIIGAMESEIAEIKENMTVNETVNIAGIDFTKGTFGKVNVVVAKCGVGKVFAAACTQAMIMKFNPALIINIGVCGALSDELDLCDIVVGEKTVQYDMDTSAVGDPVGLISGINKIYFDCDAEFIRLCEAILKERKLNYKKGVVATGDRFLNSRDDINRAKGEFAAISGDMESASIGHVCFINNVPFGILRSISDKGDEQSAKDFSKTVNKATHIIFEIVMDLFR